MKKHSIFALSVSLMLFFACQKQKESKTESPIQELTEESLKNTPFKSVFNTDSTFNETGVLLKSIRKMGYKTDDFDFKNLWVYRTKSDKFNVYVFFDKSCKISKTTETISFMSVIEYKATGLKEISTNKILNQISNGKISRHEYYKYNMTGELVGGAFLLNGKAIENEISNFKTTVHNCYMSYSACVETQVASLTSDNLGQTLCEWMPCRTMSNLSCTILRQEGYIYGGPGFNFENCGTIYL